MTTPNHSVLPSTPAEAGEVRAPELRCGVLLGVLVAVGTDPETQLTRALVKCTEEEIKSVQHLPMMDAVAVVPWREYQRNMTDLLAYRQGGVTEEMLRRNDGYIKVGKGCMIVAAETHTSPNNDSAASVAERK